MAMLTVGALLCLPLSFQSVEDRPAGAAGSDDGPLPVLVISGANNHDWEWTTPSLARILEESGRFEVAVTYDPSSTLANPSERARFAAFVVDYNGPVWSEEAREGFLEAVRGGTGVVIIHAANNNSGWPEFERLVGDLWRKGTGHGRFHAFDVDIVDRDHTVTRSLPTLIKHPDELYHRLVNVHGVERRVLASAFSDPETGGSGQREPMILVRDYGKGRVFHTPLGHVWKGVLPSQASHRDPQFRGLVVRGTEWAATGRVHDDRTAPAPLTEAERAAGWRSLMDPTLWQSAGGGDLPAGWRFDGDTLVRAASAGDIVTRELFGDFELSWQWKTTIAGNSGVKYRVPADAKPPVGPEYQLLDRWGDEKSEEHRAGALYDVVARSAEPGGLWGEFRTARIVARGTRLEHWLDGVKVMEVDTASPGWAAAIEDSKFRGRAGFATGAGRILLQDHGDEVWIRGMRVRALGDAPAQRAADPANLPDGDGAPSPGAAAVDAAPTPLFDGQTALTRWSHVGDAAYRLDGDVLVGNAGPRRKQSFLVSEETLHDFELLVDVKIAVLGNSGIQLRSHVSPDGRLHGYQAEIDPTDRSWSAGIYDEGRRGWLNDLSDNRPAREAFDRGGWNTYRIRCEGPRIRTWLNGVPAADLLDGADLSGHLGFQIHGGDDDIEIRWRGARVQRLGAHTWDPLGDFDALRLPADVDAVRVRVTGEGPKAVLHGAAAVEVPLADDPHWRRGGANEVTTIRADDRVVVQVNDHTVFDDTVEGFTTLEVADAATARDWRACR